MKALRRIVGYLRYERRAIALSLVCAVLVAILFSLSLAAVLPLMKVMIGEEGLHGWVNRAVLEERAGLKFHEVPVREYLAGEAAGPERRIPLQVSFVERESPAAEAGFKPQDVITSVSWPDGETERGVRQVQLDRWARGGAQVEVRVRRPDETQATLTLEMGEPPFYAPAAYSVLRVVPDPKEFATVEQHTRFVRDSIMLMIVLILVATVLRCTFRFAQEYLVDRLAFRTMVRVRTRTYANAVRLGLLHFSQEGVGDTTSRFVQDSNRVQTGIKTLLGKMVREPFTMVMLAVLAFSVNAKMTAIAVLGAPAAGFAINRLGKQMRRATKRTLENWSRMLSRLHETFAGIRVVKGYHQEAAEEQRFRQVNDALLRQQYKVAKISAGSGPLIEMLGMVAAGAGMLFAANFMAGGEMATPDFFTLVVLLAALAESGRKLGDVAPRLQAANAAAERVFQLMDAPAETDAPDAVELGRMSESLAFEGVKFQYPNTLAPALIEIDLEVQAGETVALVGPNGSGKTTLASLIPRFFEPGQGRVVIDGKDIREVTLASLRRQIGIVTQQTIVFRSSVAANISYAMPEASRGEIVAAAKKAYADEFIEQLGQGYDTLVGEQGATLSGGQLQRIAIARAILCDPAILIFDEATSQIDSESEAKIQKALVEFTQGRTSFIIAHRLSTIVNADRIVVMDRGRVVDQGPHEELLESCLLYRTLYQTQFAAVTR